MFTDLWFVRADGNLLWAKRKESRRGAVSDLNATKTGTRGGRGFERVAFEQ